MVSCNVVALVNGWLVAEGGGKELHNLPFHPSTCASTKTIFVQEQELGSHY
jgi:1,4-dihydroxy-2-naphthoyl-CoA synthase